MDKARILIFTHDSSLYGASKSLLTLLEYIVQYNLAKVFVVLPYNGSMEQKLTDLGINFKVISYPRAVYSDSGASLVDKLKLKIRFIRKEQRVLRQLKDISEAFKPDLIYTNTSVITIGYKLSKNLKIRHIWHIREYGDLDYNFKFLPVKFIVKYKIRQAYKIIYVSEDLEKHWKLPKYKGKVIYNGIYSKDYIPVLKNNNVEDIKISILGAVTLGKGQLTAIRAVKLLENKFPAIKLYIYGNITDKNYSQQITQFITVNNLKEKVIFCDFVSDVQNIVYSDTRLILSCSSNEAFGRTIVEAMRNGVPVIANANGGPKEIINDNLDGLLYNQTAENLAAKIDLILSDSNLYQRVATNAINSAKEKFSKEIYCQNVCNFINLKVND